MGSLFGSKSPAPTPPIPPAAPVEEATFKAGGDDEGRGDLKKRAQGKKRLQIPLTKGKASSGLGIPK
jgi:hypothetical protein